MIERAMFYVTEMLLPMIVKTSVILVNSGTRLYCNLCLLCRFCAFMLEIIFTKILASQIISFFLTCQIIILKNAANTLFLLYQIYTLSVLSAYFTYLNGGYDRIKNFLMCYQKNNNKKDVMFTSPTKFNFYLIQLFSHISDI